MTQQRRRTTRRTLKEKLAQLRNWVNIRTSNIKEMVNKVDAEACESTCHECTSKEEVEIYKEDIVIEKEELIKKKDMENKDIMRKQDDINI